MPQHGASELCIQISDKEAASSDHSVRSAKSEWMSDRFQWRSTSTVFDAHRAPGGKVARDQRGRPKQRGHREERQRVGRRDSVEKPAISRVSSQAATTLAPSPTITRRAPLPTTSRTTSLLRPEPYSDFQGRAAAEVTAPVLHGPAFLRRGVSGRGHQSVESRSASTRASSTRRRPWQFAALAPEPSRCQCSDFSGTR